MLTVVDDKFRVDLTRAELDTLVEIFTVFQKSGSYLSPERKALIEVFIQTDD